MESSNNVKKTCLYDKHVAYGGKIVEFGGFYLPIEYTSLSEEHNAVRTDAGVFDVSHMGEIFVTGKDTVKYLEYLLTSNITNIKNYRMQYALSLYDDGNVVDDLMVYKFNDQKVLLCVNASNCEKDYEYFLSKQDGFDVQITNKSSEYGQLALQGVNASSYLSKLTDENVSEMKFYDFTICKINGDEMIVSRSGYTGGDGYEIYGKNEDIVKLFDRLKEMNVTLCGLGCRDTLRFEGALPLYGHEISDKINPVMAGLNFALDFTKDFIGKDALLKYKENPTKKLVALELNKGIARSEYPILNLNEEEIGYVTTGYLIPGHSSSKALALIDINYSTVGTKLLVKIRKKNFECTVCSKKFMEKIYKR